MLLQRPPLPDLTTNYYMKIQKSKLKKIVNEEYVSLLNEEKARLTLLREYDKLLESGLSRDQADARIINRLDEGLFDALLENIKEWLFAKLLEALGVEPNSILFRALKNAIGNMSLEDWKGVFSGDCETTTEVILGAITETITEVFAIDNLADMVGYEPNGILYDLVGGTAREYVGGMVNNATKSLRDPLTKWICSFKFGDVVDNLRSGASSVVDSAKEAIAQ